MIDRSKKYVANGVKYLDKTFGRKNWIKKINLKKFCIADSNTCVCGQIFEDHFRGFMQTDAYHESKGGVKFGFEAGGSGFIRYQYSYDILRRIWEKKFKRLGAK